MGIDISQLQLCPHPIFIIGSPRSGTSILAWSLHHHSQLWTSHESDLLFNLFGRGHLDKAFHAAKSRPEGTWLQEQGVGRSEFLEYMGLGLNALFTNRSQRKYWVDQTPLNTLLVDVLVEMFPGAFFLHILRDSRRVLHSMMHFNNGLSDELKAKLMESDSLPNWSTDFREGCRTWRIFVERSMEFCARYPTRGLTVVNEEIVANPYKGFRKICEFLQVPYEDGPANFFKSNRINSSFGPNASQGASSQALSEPWREWTQDQKAIFLEEVGPILTKYDLITREELSSLTA